MDLARAKQNDQGNYECEVWTTVAEGEKEYTDCKKNPEHIKFIPARDFSIKDLPGPFQDDVVFEYASLMSERTVRLLVKYTSEERPDGYPFSNYRGKYVNHTGSGLVYCYEYSESCDDQECDESINSGGDGGRDKDNCVNDTRDESEKSGEIDREFEDSDDDKNDDIKIYDYFDLKLEPCPCKDCSSSDEPRRQWGYVYILTAKHVVYDNIEAASTVAELNFNDKSDRDSLQKLYVVGISHEDLNKGDWTILSCVTHDRELYVRLYETSKRFTELRDIIYEKYWESPSRLALVVSHPHGWVKKVTIGEWTERQIHQTTLDGDELVQYTYNTSTCRGSSGAPVLILGMRKSDPNYKTWLAQHHVHCGSIETDMNVSGIELENFVDFDNADEGCKEDDEDEVKSE